MNYFLGIDGGGTKTKAAVCDENGQVICKVIGSTINFYSIGMSACRKNLKELMQKIEKECGISTFTAAVIGCSALDDVADEETTQALCGGIIDSPTIHMDSDAFIALMSTECDCVAICGTGSMAIGFDEDNKVVVKGGWGHILGDEGSAYSIAVKALKRCCSYWDKEISPPLLEAAKKFFFVDDFRKIIDVIYAPTTSKAEIAEFSAQVDALAKKGCEPAIEIIKGEAASFAQTVVSLLISADYCYQLGLVGGVFENSLLFREEFINQVHKTYPHLIIKMLEIPPEEIALRLAMETQKI